jgi:hypothetical protein
LGVRHSCVRLAPSGHPRFHPVRKIYHVHLRDFLADWLRSQRDDGRFSTSVEDHLRVTDKVMAAILEAARGADLPGHSHARRIVERDHFHLVYQWNPVDAKINPAAADAVFLAACDRYGEERVRRDSRPPKNEGVDFPVLTQDGRVASSLELSQALQQLPAAAFDFVFVEGSQTQEAREWLKADRTNIIQPKAKEETDGSA